MNWYPWLNEPYRQIITAYQSGRGHHALLLHSMPGNGAQALCYGISRWLICQERDGLKSCGQCHSCRLMLAGNHPDYHILEVEKGKSTVSVDAVRKLIETLSHHAQQSGNKVVYIPQVEALTDAAANALLKTLEEPAKDTYFLLGSDKQEDLLATIRSRCLSHFLPAPDLQIALYWLQKQKPGIATENAITALKICQGAPVSALALLDEQRWQKRNALCHSLSHALQTGDMLSLLPSLNIDEVPDALNWLLSLFADAIKIQQGAGAFCINQDQQSQVLQLAGAMNRTQLINMYDKWLYCRHQLLTVPALNQELILTNQLLQWEASLAVPTF
ncbi:TPA: DNA polymerase III subunit delta' [Providencia rettgeri]|nr:DNA polymerase III subunit delta' [Providencia rettgeri]HEM8341302.1 DNA polymerase III subunit delta' [Providencia rettgeri]